MHELIGDKLQQLFMIGGISKQIPDPQYDVLVELVKTASVPNMKVIEIGSWTGLSAVIMGQCIQRMKGTLYCVDHFKGSPNGAEHLLETAKVCNIKEKFLSNISLFNLNDTVVLYEKSSQDAVTLFEDNSYDMIFIDGDHSPKGIASDIASYYSKLKVGGIFCGHDFDLVKETIVPIFKTLTVIEDIWYLRKEQDYGI